MGGAMGGAAARSAGFIETNDGARGGRSRAAWRPLTCPARGSSTFEVFFPPLKLFRWCFFSCSGVEQLSASSKTSNVAALRWSCAALLFASRGQGEPHDASSLHRENDGRGGVTDDHLCR